MSDRMSFYEVRSGSADDWDHVCLCKDEEDAQKICEMLIKYTGEQHHIEMVEICASVDLDLRDYY